MAIVYINVEYAKTRDEEKVSSSENDTTTKNTTKVSDEEMIINMIQDNPQITGEGGADIFERRVRTKFWTTIGLRKEPFYVFKRTKRYCTTDISSNRVCN